MIRAIRNAHIPVNRLPPEILSRVFQHHDCEQDRVVATHVCQYWRSALISSPPLWTYLRLISDSHVDRALTYLKRSKSVTIDIEMTPDLLSSPDVPRHFAPHISRIRSLVVHGPLMLHAAPSLLLCEPVPALEHLTIERHHLGVPANPVDRFLGEDAPLLRSAVFIGICPILESPFPLPSLTELHLGLTKDMGPLHMNSLFRLYSSYPLLQEIYIKISCEIIEDICSGQVTSLNSLVKLEYACVTAIRFLPFLRLPRLEQLSVSTPWEKEKVDSMADILPYNGRVLLSGSTAYSYSHREGSQIVKVSGKGVIASFSLPRKVDFPTPPGLFLDRTYIPLGQIEDLRFEGDFIPENYPTNLFENVTKLKVIPWGESFSRKVFQPLYPDREKGIPCPSLREIEYNFSADGGIRSLLNLADQRKRANRQLKLVCVLGSRALDPDIEQILRWNVGELRVNLRPRPPPMALG